MTRATHHVVVPAAVAIRAGRLDPAFFFYMQYVAALDSLALTPENFDTILERARRRVEQGRAEARKLRDEANRLLDEARRIEALYPEKLVR